ncbi:S9 family peptidase [Shewanella sp. Isolate11]|uniref:alpha/beta hydrolase family protein n=1 Tax=Shewanella sp. Isolate11 TaxID=2908530 RepID=UPI001EFD28F7|nr:S9 family peptidase [Shewanella sp. Isolate11]MCG9697799.1 S9 family peptidase [Shewanella sp. Isolate11]
MKLIKIFSFVSMCLFSLNGYSASTDQASLFSRSAEFSNVKVSPDGSYLSAIASKEGKNILMILDAKTKKTTNVVHFPDNAQVGGYEWVNEERVVLAKEYLKGWNDHPMYYGELLAVNADGSQPTYLFGYKGGSQQAGSMIKKNTPIQATAFILDPMPEDHRYMLVKAKPWGSGGNNWRENLEQVYRVDVYRGKRNKIATSPISFANFLPDHDGEIRFVSGTRDYITSSLYYRDDGEWVDTDKLNLNLDDISPIAFGDDKNSLYVLASENGQPKAIYLINVKTGDKKLISQDKHVDPSNVWINRINKRLFAVEYENGYPTYEFVDNDEPQAKIIKQLLAALPGHQIHLISQTNDMSKMVIKAFNDRNPGDYYVFDAKNKKLEYLASQKKWLDPDAMAEVKPITFVSRDGTEINGYLTLPHGKEAKNLPLVVNPHGGPHGPRDWWGFSPQNQLIANEGAAVLQVNFRGSGGYGKSFEFSGHQKWGTEIQYDIIDATKYVIEQGIVDKNRICIVGGSFGGYSALQSPILAPDLFKCAIGFAGIYDLELMYSEGDIQEIRTGSRYLNQVIGKDPQILQQMSPTHNIDKLKAKLMLVHGGEDERAPIEQLEALEKALNQHNYPYEKLVMSDEGHGFYNDEHKAKYFRQMMSFLKQNLQL